MDAGPDIETPHKHHHTGSRWLDIALGVIAISISLFSAALAVQNGKAMDRMVEANSWPDVIATYQPGDAEGHALYKLSLQNNGVGPARVKTLNISYKGRPVASLHDLITQVAQDAGGVQLRRVGESGAYRVIPARQSVDILIVQEPFSSPEMVQAFLKAAPKIDTSVCYCSIFNECWTSGDDEPKPVKVCRGKGLIP
ncbi:MAG TPA: hypothetical protein VGL66_05830 [Caulobacteraceae bacterium]|jgi:hypothetical protein